MRSRDILTLTCLNCGTEFGRPRYQHESNVRLGRRGPFCSKTCGRVVQEPPRTPMTLERFWSNVDRSGDCWTWTGALNSWGYGHFKSGRLDQKAHRWIYEQTVGLIPAGLVICHRCDNPPCVRPDHLFVGTYADNTADMYAKGRAPSQKRHAA